MGYGLDGRGSITGRSNRYFSSFQRPDRLWVPPSLLQISGALPQGTKRLGLESDHSLYLVPRSKMVELFLHYPIRLQGVVLN
jgi:hypothetical protein